MAAFKTLRTLIRKNPNPRSLSSPFTHHHSPIPHWNPNPNPRFSSPLSRPSPPWILFQSASPLYLRGKDGFFPGDPIRPGSLGLGFGYATEAGSSVGEKRKEGGDGREKERFFNLPNMVSMSRMISGPVIGWMIMNQMYLPAFYGLAISGATDWLDGFLARRMGINSVIGSYLDPLADKVLIGSVALAMVERDLLHPGLVGLVVFRDVGLVCGAIYRRGSMLGWKWKNWSDFFDLDAAHREKVEPLFISKVNTVLQLLLVGTALLQPEFGSEGTQLYITYLSWLVASTTIASSAAYGVWYLRRQAMAT